MNKTIIRRDENKQIIHTKVPMANGDTIMILGRLGDDNSAFYWELTLRDPMKTNRVVSGPSFVHLEYDWVQAKLFRIKGSEREEISELRPQEHKLVRYMDQRNRKNGDAPVMCTFEDLIESIWGDEIGRTRTEINHLVHGLRQKIESDKNDPRFLQTVRGLGYRLETHALIE